MNDNITLSDQAASPTNKTFNLFRKAVMIAKDTFETIRKTDEFDDTPETITSRAKVTEGFKTFRNSVQYLKVNKNATTGKLSPLRITLSVDGNSQEFTQAEIEAGIGYVQSYAAQTGAKAEMTKGVM